jgi:2-polyprenyl-3-methyl-5-hydroxy-6-metoxy-1,4-benzoquinol methylase
MSETMKHLDEFKSAYTDESVYFDENKQTQSLYLKWIMDLFKKKKVENVLSLGLGSGHIVNEIHTKLENKIKNHIVLEGSLEIIELSEESLSCFSSVKVENVCFENFNTDQKFDVIEMGFILEHVTDPFALLTHFRQFLKEDGVLIIVVPNARSLHRLIGFHSGHLNNIYQFNESDFQAGHKHYFDCKKLKDTVVSAGFNIHTLRGLYLKPFSTGQLHSLNLEPTVIEGLYDVAVDMPEISNSIYIEALLQK